MLSFSEALISRRGPSLRVSPDRRAARRGRGWGIDWVREISGWSDPLAVGCARTPHKCCEGWLRRICESVCARVCGRSREGGRGGKHRGSHSLPTRVHTRPPPMASRCVAATRGVRHTCAATHLEFGGVTTPVWCMERTTKRRYSPDITGLGFLQSPLLHGRRLAGAPVSRTAPQASTDGATPARARKVAPTTSRAVHELQSRRKKWPREDGAQQGASFLNPTSPHMCRHGSQ